MAEKCQDEWCSVCIRNDSKWPTETMVVEQPGMKGRHWRKNHDANKYTVKYTTAKVNKCEQRYIKIGQL